MPGDFPDAGEGWHSADSIPVQEHIRHLKLLFWSMDSKSHSGRGPSYDELDGMISRSVSTDPEVTHDPLSTLPASLFDGMLMRGRVRRLQEPQRNSRRKSQET